MSLEIFVSPGGKLGVSPLPELAPTVADAWFGRLENAFAESSARGLLLLAGEALTLPLPPSPVYWRDFARTYFQRLCHVAAGATEEAPILPAVPSLDRAEFAEWTLQAPPMRGGEFIAPDVLLALWQELDELARQDIAAAGSLSMWLARQNPLWRAVGRVTFHLAENKRDELRPFAFLATYTHRLSDQGRPQHLPLARALQEYAGARNKTALSNLLSPIQRAAETSELARGLIESRQVFQPLAWTPSEAHRFLHNIPLFEECGLLVRVPDWWRAGHPSRPQVQVRIGKKPGTTLGFDSLLDFSVETSLNGEKLTHAEWKDILNSKDGLTLLRGQWVEIDREQLQEALAHWQRFERMTNGVSFLDAMRLLAGFNRAGAPGEAAEDPAINGWTRVIPGQWLQEMLSSMRDPARLDEFDPERDLRASLRPYQCDGARWLWFMTRLRLGACLADDMGLGKTIQTISLLLQLKRESASAAGPSLKSEISNLKSQTPIPSLLVAPASLLANWKNELARFAPSLDVFFAHPSETPAALLKTADPAMWRGKDLVVTTYTLLTRWDWLRDTDWQLAVIDEAQAIKNPGSRQTKAVKSLRTQARIALTGTPVENRIGDLWSIFDFICPGLLGGAGDFSQMVGKLSAASDAASGGRHFAPLRELTGPYILRRLKTDKKIIADLPDKTEMVAWCTLSKTQAALYAQSVRDLAQQLRDVANDIERRGLVLTFLMRFKQICNHPSHWLKDDAYTPAESGKFERLRELAEEIAARQEKALIFTQFREMTGPLAEYLSRVFGQPGLILHGATPVKERQKLVQQFQMDGGPPFFVLSLKAGGTGLNLTAAAHVIHFDRWWNPAVENQATDRAFRIGQKHNVLVHKFVCRGTVEERVNALLEEKRDLASALVEGNSSTSLLTEMADDELLRFVSLDLRSALRE